MKKIRSKGVRRVKAVTVDAGDRGNAANARANASARVDADAHVNADASGEGALQPVTLPATYDIQHVTAVASQLRERIHGARPVLVDASGVTHTDTAGLQLLLAARRAAHTHGLTFQWAAVSAELRATSGLLGLAEALGLP